MELKRMNVDSIFNTPLYEVHNGDYVYWTPELQEAWDKQQEMELVNDDYCPVCEINVNCYELSKYCSNCGQKIKR